MRKFLLAAAFVGGLAGGTATAYAQTPSAPAAGAATYSTANSTIGDLLDNPETKAIVDKDMPGFSTNSQVDMARTMTFRAIQQYAPDQMTDAVLSKMDADLAKAPAKAK